jgi:hypothetical protein
MEVGLYKFQDWFCWREAKERILTIEIRSLKILFEISL